MSVVVNPIESLTFVELPGTDSFTSTLATTWEDWNLSALIPANAKVVLVNTDNGLFATGVRPNGSAQARIAGAYGYSMTSTHTARIVEIYSSGALRLCAWLMGYWV